MYDKNWWGELEIAVYGLSGMLIVPFFTLILGAFGFISVKLAFVLLIASFIIFRYASHVTVAITKHDKRQDNEEA